MDKSLSKRIARSSLYLLLLLIPTIFFSATTTFGGNQANTFLPFVAYLILNTPTPTPTPTQPPPANPVLEDGYYEASLPEGYLWFTVSNDGTTASDAGFYFRFAPWCSWASYSFGGLTRDITDGGFSFFVVDTYNREFVASLGCSSTSSTEAYCTARRGGLGQCSGASGTASLKNK